MLRDVCSICVQHFVVCCRSQAGRFQHKGLHIGRPPCQSLFSPSSSCSGASPSGSASFCAQQLVPAMDRAVPARVVRVVRQVFLSRSARCLLSERTRVVWQAHQSSSFCYVHHRQSCSPCRTRPFRRRPLSRQAESSPPQSSAVTASVVRRFCSVTWQTFFEPFWSDNSLWPQVSLAD